MTSKYYDQVSDEVKAYFQMLEPDFPNWLHKYIKTRELQKQRYISVTCGTLYTDLFESDFFYSSLDHSVAVALIVWHFTRDKKQTLAGLFHDIATPAFKHCVDFLNGDYMKQESTESLTTKIITESPEITKLLKRDGIDISAVDNYHLYPIADNDTPKLSADRLEYSFSNALFIYKILELGDIKEIYEDLAIQKNEHGEIELGFKTQKIANKFVAVTSKMSVIYRDDRTRYSMQFIADILKRLNSEGEITLDDLYNLKESEVIDIINESKYSNVFRAWREAREIKTSKNKPKGVYFVHHGAKIRYIDPLCNNSRLSKVCENAKAMISKNLAYDMENYVYLDFDF